MRSTVGLVLIFGDYIWLEKPPLIIPVFKPQRRNLYIQFHFYYPVLFKSTIKVATNTLRYITKLNGSDFYSLQMPVQSPRSTPSTFKIVMLHYKVLDFSPAFLSWNFCNPCSDDLSDRNAFNAWALLFMITSVLITKVAHSGSLDSFRLRSGPKIPTSDFGWNFSQPKLWRGRRLDFEFSYRT